jgi:Ring finger domain
MFVSLHNYSYYFWNKTKQEFGVAEECYYDFKFVQLFLCAVISIAFHLIKSRVKKQTTNDHMNCVYIIWASFSVSHKMNQPCEDLAPSLSEWDMIAFNLQTRPYFLIIVGYWVIDLTYTYWTTEKPKFVFVSAVKESTTCSICLEDLHDAVTPPRCKHLYHKTCLEEWFYVSPVCPQCRSAM